MKKINYDINDYQFKNFDNQADWIEFKAIDFNHEPAISVVESVYSNKTFTTVPKEVFEDIRDGTYAGIIKKIRETDNKEKRRELKKKLPAILFGGKFKSSRKNLAEASNLICIDFDHVEDVKRFRFRLKYISYVYGFFISPSGDGLKVIVRTDVEDDRNYKKIFQQLMDEFEKRGLKADSSKQNINDLCFFSYDADAYLNTKATIWRKIEYKNHIESSWNDSQIKESVEYIIEQIKEKRIDITSTYDDWLKICFGLADQFGEDGRDYFHSVSQYYKDYDQTVCDKQFDYCFNSNRAGITIRSFFKIAKENGFKLQKAILLPKYEGDTFDQAYYTGEELLLRKITQLPTLVDPLLPKIGLVAIGGSSDVGKSSFLRNLAISISSGEEKFLQFPISAKHKRVIYVSTEDDDFAISFLINKHNNTLKKPSSGFKTLIYLFETQNLLKKLESLVKSNPVDLIVIDTFPDLYSGEMNQTNRIRSYLHNFALLARKYKCLVLMLHHTGKRTEDLPPSKNNLLGSQGFEAKMRLVLELRKDRDDPDIRHLCVVKANYLPKEYRETSYALKFSSDMIFEFTGQRVPFEDLTSQKKDREAEKQEWIKVAEPLIKDGKTYMEVSEILKKEGFNVSKSTIQRELTKN